MPPHHFQMQVRAFLVFIQIQILLLLHLIRVRPQQQAPPAPPPQRPPPARPRRHTFWVRPYITHREEKGEYDNLLAELYAFDVPGFTNFMRMTPEFFEMIKARVHPHLVRQATNYRGPLSVGMKLAINYVFWPLGSHTSFWLAGLQYPNLC